MEVYDYVGTMSCEFYVVIIAFTLQIQKNKTISYKKRINIIRMYQPTRVRK